MANLLALLVLYTPLPWLLLMYVATFRHDLARVARPLTDNGDLRSWWSVCIRLRLIPAETPQPPRRVLNPAALAVVAAALVSVFWLVPFYPSPWYFLMPLQAVSALVLFFALVSRIGRLPSNPYSDTLPYPRLGSRIRHLQNGGGTEAPKPMPTTKPPAVEQTPGGQA